MKNPPLIFTPRCGLAYVIELLVTMLLWAAFVYLFFHRVMDSVAQTSLRNAVESANLLSASTGSLTLYALIGLVNGVIIVAWAKYNAYRGKEERRKPIPHLRADELAASFGISPTVLHSMYATRIMTVHHDEHGAIANVEPGSPHSKALAGEEAATSGVGALSAAVPVHNTPSVVSLH